VVRTIAHLTRYTKFFFNLEDDKENITFIDNLASRIKCDNNDVKKLARQIEKFDVFKIYTAWTEEGYKDNADNKDVRLVLLARKDIAPNDVVSDLITAEDGGKQQILINVKQRLINEKRTVPRRS